jgi:hypothetical protein
MAASRSPIVAGRQKVRAKLDKARAIVKYRFTDHLYAWSDKFNHKAESACACLRQQSGLCVGVCPVGGGRGPI